MIGLLLLLWAVLWLAWAVARWTWVAQLEHYIPGSCRQTAQRWLTARPANWFLLVVPIALLTVVGDSDVRAAAVVAVGAPALAVLPVPMMQDPRRLGLTVTARVKRLLAVTTVVLAVAVAVLAVLAAAVGAPIPAAIGAVLAIGAAPALLDLALGLARPIEAREAEGFRSAAEAKLRAIDPLVIAITGSYGKTSTKNHVRDLLTGHTEVFATPASWNNTNGLSRAINEQLHDDHRIFVAEMGTYGPGEIAAMVGWVRPSIVAISAIGPMHLERMKTLDGVLAAKSEILQGAGTVALWVDDERLATLADQVVDTHEVIRVGTHGSRGDLDVTVEETDDGRVVVRRNGPGGTTEVGAVRAGSGLHPGNIGLAVALAGAAGADDAHLGDRLAALEPPPHRSVVDTTDTGVVVIDNTFNANPDGAREAVRVLSDHAPGRKVVVTPGMVELGPLAHEENRRLGQAVADAGAELIVVGRVNRRALLEGAKAGATSAVDSREAARLSLRNRLAKGDGVLWLNDLPPHYP